MLGCFLKHNKEVYKQFKTQQKTKEEASKKVTNGKKNGKKAKAESDESSSDSDSSSSEDEKVAKKRKQKEATKAAASKKKKDSSSESDSSSSDSEEDKKKTKKRPRTSSISSNTRSKDPEPVKKPMLPPPKVPLNFQRVNEERIMHLMQNPHMDSSYESKAKFGTGDSYGGWSNDRLNDKVGAGFKKEKNKMKNKNFHSSGTFNQNAVNSIKL